MTATHEGRAPAAGPRARPAWSCAPDREERRHVRHFRLRRPGAGGRPDGVGGAAATGVSRLRLVGRRGRASNGALAHEKQVGKIGAAAVDLPDATAGIGHTRWATHGAVTRANAHPHFDSTGALALIHNGIVENFATAARAPGGARPPLPLRDRQRGDRPPHRGRVERPAHGGDLTSATRAAFAQLHGLNAIIVMRGRRRPSSSPPRTISPLVVGLGAGATYIASDMTALLSTPAGRLPGGRPGGDLTPDGVTSRSIATGAPVTPPVERGHLGGRGCRPERLPALHGQGDRRAAAHRAARWPRRTPPPPRRWPT